MNQVVKTEALLEILSPLQSIINDNHVIPILQNVKLDFSSDVLTATGNNTEVVCINSTKHKSKKEYSVCVNFLMLYQIVKSITDKEIVIDIHDKKMEVTHKKGTFDLPTENSKEYPATEKENFKSKAKVKGTAFKSSLKVATRFIANEDLDAMSNISIQIGKKIHVRATDRHRLFEEKIKGKGDEASILISGKSSVSLCALIEDLEEDIEMVYNDNSIFFSFENKEIMVVQQQGDFPVAMFKKVISQIDEAQQLKLDVKSFVTALKRVSIMTGKDKINTVKITGDKNKAVLECESESFSTKGVEEIEAKFPRKFKVGFNIKYLAEILSVFEKEPEIYLDERNFFYIKQNKKRGGIAPVSVS